MVNEYCTVPTVTYDSHSPHLPYVASVCISFLLMNYVQLYSKQAAYLPQFTHTYARLLSAMLALLVTASRSLINSGRGGTFL